MIRSRLLIAEDDIPFRQSLAEYLSDCGFEVDEAEDGDHAAVMLNGIVKYDLLITDIDMPGHLDGNGLVTCARIRQPQIPVIYASGCPEHLTNTVGKHDAFVGKPFAGSQVANLIRQMLAACDEN